jgi:hypothetical protein
MKRFAVLLSVALLAMMVVAPVSADLPPGGWWGGIQIANLGTSDANIALTVYTETDEYTASATAVAPGASANFLSTTIGPDGSTWRGAGVASADQPIAAVASLTNKLLGTAGIAGGTARALYPGVNEPDMTVFFPLVKNQFPAGNAKTTSFFVQNAGSAAATFYAEFKIGATSYTHMYANIGPGQMTLIDPADAGFPAGSVGSLVVTSTVPLAGIVNEYKIPASGEPALDLMATRGFAPADAGNALLFPIFKNNFASKHVGVQIQNTGSVATTAYMTATETFCFSGTPAVKYANLSIEPGASVTFLGPNVIASGCLGSAIVTADQPIVGTASESRLFASQFTVYFGFNAMAASDNVFAPLYKQVFVDNNTSGLQVQNTTGVDTDCTLTWSTVGTTDSYVYNDTIPANGSKTYYRMDNATDYPDANWGASTRVPNGTNNAVKVVCDQAVVAVVQEANANAAAQDAGNYEAFNQ